MRDEGLRMLSVDICCSRVVLACDWSRNEHPDPNRCERVWGCRCRALLVGYCGHRVSMVIPVSAPGSRHDRLTVRLRAAEEMIRALRNTDTLGARPVTKAADP